MKGMRYISLPTKMYAFICFWRCRGVSIKGAFHLWKLANIPFTKARPALQARDIEWARRL